jgi:hypothetical protein
MKSNDLIRLRNVTLTSAVPNQQCKVCGEAAEFFDVVDFFKHCAEPAHAYNFGLSGIQVCYYKCGFCDFIFTDFCDDWEADDFSEYIYNEKYVLVDPDYLKKRPENLAAFFSDCFSEIKDLSFLDYGSGAGIFVNEIKKKGFGDVVGYDPYSNPVRPDALFDVVTCFEVIEHSPWPEKTLADMVSFLGGDGLVVISQTVQPYNISSLRGSWWYIGPRNGHISMFSVFTFYCLSSKYGLELYRLGDGLFLMVRPGSSLLKRLGSLDVKKWKNIVNLQPDSNNEKCWWGVETSPGGMFRWTAQEKVEWRVRLASGLNLIRLPFVNEIQNGFSGNCRFLIDGKPCAFDILDNAFCIDFEAERMGWFDVCFIQPKLVSPKIWACADERELGIAIYIQNA